MYFITAFLPTLFSPAKPFIKDLRSSSPHPALAKFKTVTLCLRKRNGATTEELFSGTLDLGKAVTMQYGNGDTRYNKTIQVVPSETGFVVTLTKETIQIKGAKEKLVSTEFINLPLVPAIALNSIEDSTAYIPCHIDMETYYTYTANVKK